MPGINHLLGIGSRRMKRLISIFRVFRINVEKTLNPRVKPACRQAGPRMTILTACFYLSFPQVLSGNPVSIMIISTYLPMNLIFSGAGQ